MMCNPSHFKGLVVFIYNEKIQTEFRRRAIFNIFFFIKKGNSIYETDPLSSDPVLYRFQVLPSDSCTQFPLKLIGYVLYLRAEFGPHIELKC